MNKLQIKAVADSVAKEREISPVSAEWLKKNLSKAFEKCDIIIIPTTPGDAPKIKENTDPVSMYLIDLFTVIANITGVPALNMPFDKGNQGLPIGMQIIGDKFSEEQLFETAKLIGGIK